MEKESAQNTVKEFIKSWDQIQKRVYEGNVEKGFWDKPMDDGTRIALMHSELSEALEALRYGNPPDKHLPNLDSVSVELADVVIRVMDFCQGRGYDVAGAVIAKMNYNTTREHMHGGKKF